MENRYYLSPSPPKHVYITYDTVWFTLAIHNWQMERTSERARLLDKNGAHVLLFTAFQPVLFFLYSTITSLMLSS